MDSDYPLVVVLFTDAHFQGNQSTLLQDTPNLADLAINDEATSITICEGPGYAAWKEASGGVEPTIGLFKNADYGGRSLVLQKGSYENLAQFYNFNDITSSVKFNPPLASPNPIVLPTCDKRVLMILTMFTDRNFHGKQTTLIESVSNFATMLGGVFNDRISSITLQIGPDCREGEPVAVFFEDTGFSGDRSVIVWPGAYPDASFLHGMSSVSLFCDVCDVPENIRAKAVVLAGKL